MLIKNIKNPNILGTGGLKVNAGHLCTQLTSQQTRGFKPMLA